MGQQYLQDSPFQHTLESCVLPRAQCYIQWVYKAPLCFTLTISEQKIVSGSLLLTQKNSSPPKKTKNFCIKQLFSADTTM